MSTSHAYRSCDLNIDLCEVDEGLVEVLDSLGGVFGRLVTDITYAAVREESDVGDGEFAKVLTHVVFSEPRGQAAHKDPRRLHGCARIEMWEEVKNCDGASKNLLRLR
jgi:hypothetical protein